MSTRVQGIPHGFPRLPNYFASDNELLRENEGAEGFSPGKDRILMGMSWKLTRVAGIDVFLHPTFLLLLAYVGMVQGGIGSILLGSSVFGCVLLHELGHALMARRFGIETEDITLFPIGGVARLRRMPRAPGAELLIALAGAPPAAGA